MIVVIGAGPAGARCAALLAARGEPVTLLGEEPGVPYDRVALSRYLAREIASGELEQPVPDGVLYRDAAPVVAIDRAGRGVLLADGSRLAYRRLILATGSAPVRLELPGAGLPGVLAYRTREDVRAMLAGAGPAVVIGGGLLGLEAAYGLAARGRAVTLVHGVDRLMERQLDAEAAARLAHHFAARGIALEMPARTEAIVGRDRAEGVRLADGRVLPAGLVVMAVGVRPRVELARAAGLRVGRGIVVDAAMRTSDPAILAAGECTELDGQCIGLVLPALAQAAVAARTACGEAARHVPAPDAAALKVAGTKVWSGGEIAAEDAEALVLDDPAGAYRKLLLRGDRLVGAVLYGAVEDAGWYLRLMREGVDIGAMRAGLAFGPAYAEAAA